MIEKIYAKIEEIKKEFIICSFNNLVIKIFTPANNEFKLGNYYYINTVLEMRLDRNEVNLYGFLDTIAKELYQNLRTIQGMGPKSCLNILSAKNAQDIIVAIINKDLNFLTSIPRISRITAEKIITELAKKYIKNNLVNKDLDKIIIKLKELGFTQKSIDEVVPKLDLTQATEPLMKEAIIKIKNG